MEKEDEYIDEEPSKPHMGSQHKQKSSGLFSKPAEQVSRAELSREDEKHFASIQNSFGAKMLASMGWKAGYGLGEGGKGIAVPIEASKARPQGAGVGAVNERTRAQKMEAKRRGEKVSDDEEDIRDRRKKGEQKQKAAWKTKQPKQKTKTQHMTYEEVLEALGDQPQVETTVGPILDLTGAQVSFKICTNIKLNIVYSHKKSQVLLHHTYLDGHLLVIPISYQNYDIISV